MLTRRNIAAGLGLSFAAPSVLAQTITPVSLTQTPPAPTPGAATAAEDPLFVIDTSQDRDERLSAPVRINGIDGFNFTVDTGADRSVLTEGLVQRLNLPRGPDVMVHGVSGSIQCPTAMVASLSAGDSRLADTILPILPYERVGADGLLGVDILDGRNVVMDFGRNRLEVRRSRRTPDFLYSSRDITVVANEKFGRLTIANAKIGGTRSLAFVDSGGGISIGNMALARAIAARRRRSPDIVRQARLLTAAGEMQLGEFRIVPAIVMGELRITNIPMAFADIHIFDYWSLNNQPAALLGVDVLRLFARVELDFGSDRVLFRLGQGGFAPTLNA